MKLFDLINISGKPKLYEKGTAVMWTDKYISNQLLDIHINSEIDLASRKKSTIEKTVNWILNMTKQPGKEKLNILDLGCGPGLYSQRLAEKGHRVTGVDFSKCSIEYAQNEAKKNNLNISYRHQNYLELTDENKYNLVILIYTDFGVLLPKEREQLLVNINRALKPGGSFIFDVLNDKNIEQKITPKNWELTEKGFWRNIPYLSLSESFLYEEHKVLLSQHLVIDNHDRSDIYRFWIHFFSHTYLENILGKNGFENMSFYENVLPEGDLWNGDNVTFCVTTKQKNKSGYENI